MLLAGDDDLQESPFPGVLLQISEEIDRRVKGLTERRNALWKLTHPGRAEFEREGWPDDEAKQVTT
jgi:hypothetical protein